MATTNIRVPKNASSYETGNKPYIHDVARGKWSSFKDFYCACMSHSFGVKHFSVLATFIFQEGGILFLIPYTIGLFLFAIPVFFIQSFMGQFSTSGFISAFRIAPLFKGLGYTILCLNLMSASYITVIAAFPLSFLFASFNPTLPWMTCGNSWNTENCTVLIGKEDNNTWFWETAWSAVEYYHHAVCAFEKDEEDDEFRISWRITIATVLTWVIVTVIVLQGVEKIGIILRYITITITTLFVIILIRVLFVESAMTYVLQFFVPTSIFDNIPAWIVAPFSTALSFGAGWGTILTLASFNNFKEDVGKYSTLIGFSQLGILLLCGFITQIVTYYMAHFYSFELSYYYRENMTITFGTFTFFFGVISWSNLWSILFFLALFLGELSGCVIQVLSVLTAIFDEYEPLRIYKKEFTIILQIILLVFSMTFTSNIGIYFLNRLFRTSAAVSIFICFIELMIVVWIYGRLRFQRDVKFMTNIIYSKWKFYILRFVTPLFILLTFLLFGGEVIFDGHMYEQYISFMKTAIIFKILPLLILPIYFYYKFQFATGNLLERFKLLCRPTDWYPVDSIEHRNYNDLLAASSGCETNDQLIDDIDLGDLEYTDD